MACHGSDGTTDGDAPSQIRMVDAMSLQSATVRPSAPSNAVTADEFRAAMRRLVTGVTIITATYKSRPWGMTVSAFTPVCAEPPTVLICLNRNTVLAGAVQTGGRFG